ncbi:MAG: hypothetical protein ACTJHV_09390, partial [Cellulosimicrobium funkei]
TNPVWLRQLLTERARHVLAVEPAAVAQDVREAASAALAAYAHLPGDAPGEAPHEGSGRSGERPAG